MRRVILALLVAAIPLVARAQAPSVTIPFAPDAVQGSQYSSQSLTNVSQGPLLSTGKTFANHWQVIETSAVPTPGYGGLSSNFSHQLFDCTAGGAWWTGVSYCVFAAAAANGAPIGQDAKLLALPSFLSISANQLGTGVPAPSGAGGLVAYNGVGKAAQPNLNVSGNATNLRATTIVENDSNINNCCLVASHVADLIETNPGHQNNGELIDAAIVVNGSKVGAFWDCVLCIGNIWGTPNPDSGPGGGPAGAPSSVGILLEPALYPVYGGLVQMARGLDFSSGDFTDLPIALPRAWVDKDGNAGLSDVESTGAIATINVIGGRGFVDIPTLQIGPPAAGGSQAAAHVTAMGATTAVPATKSIYYTAAPVVSGGNTTFTFPGPGLPSDLVPGVSVWSEGVQKLSTVLSVDPVARKVVVSGAIVIAPAGRVMGSTDIVGATINNAGAGCHANRWYVEALPQGGGGFIGAAFLAKCDGVGAGSITSLYFPDPGYLYQAGMKPPMLTFPNGGSQCSGTFVPCTVIGAAATPTMGTLFYYSAGGQNCVVGDVLTMGNSTTVTVAAVTASGNITGMNPPTAGSWTTLPTNTAGYPDPRIAPVSATGSCSNATVQMSWVPNAVAVDTPGAAYTRAVDIQAISAYQGTHVVFSTTISGQDKMTTSPNGFTFGTPTGGPMGAGTINASAVYAQGLPVQSSALAAFVLSASVTNGATQTMAAGTGALVLENAALVASQTVLLPPIGAAGQTAWVSSDTGISALTLQTSGGGAITNAPTSIAAGGRRMVISDGSIWHPVQ